jgi:hypothetical protein
MMTNKTDQIDLKAWKHTSKPLTWHGWASPIGLSLFIIAIGIAALAAFLALLHVAEVIP